MSCIIKIFFHVLKRTTMAWYQKISFLAIGFTRPTLSLFLIYIGYLLIGSLCFNLLESKHELESQIKAVEKIRHIQKIVRKLRIANYSDNDIRVAFFTEHKARKKSMEPFDYEWYQIFGEKVFFAFILISTIGYGNVTPKSTLAQCVCVIYTMIGLPIHVIMMRLLGVKYRGGLRDTFSVGLKVFPGSRVVLVILGFLFFAIWTGVFVFIPPIVLMAKEKWEYTQAFYFSFMSLSTIGLGDYVSGVPQSSSAGIVYALTIIATMLWMFLGLGFVSMALNMLSYVMGIYTLDKLDCKCRARTAAMEKLSVLLELMKELNWQLVKGKPDDFKKWSEIEDFRNLLADNPQEVTSEMLHRMFNIMLDLKEKAYDQVSKMQFVAIPTSDLLQQAQETIPNILSAETVKLKTVKSSSRSITILPISQSSQNSTVLSEPVRSYRNDAGSRKFDVESPPNLSSRMRLRARDALPSDIIEDRRECLCEDTKSVDDSNASEEKPNGTDEKDSIETKLKSDVTDEKDSNGAKLKSDVSEEKDSNETELKSDVSEEKASNETELKSDVTEEKDSNEPERKSKGENKNED